MSARVIPGAGRRSRRQRLAPLGEPGAGDLAHRLEHDGQSAPAFYACGSPRVKLSRRASAIGG